MQLKAKDTRFSGALICRSVAKLSLWHTASKHVVKAFRKRIRRGLYLALKKLRWLTRSMAASAPNEKNKFRQTGSYVGI